MRAFPCILLFALAGCVQAETLVTEARIGASGAAGLSLQIGTETMPVSVEKATRFWKFMKPAKLSDFAPGDPVQARISTGAKSNILRELCDTYSSERLTALRKEVVGSTVARVDAKTLVVELDGGSEFSYRYSDKSTLELSGRAASFNELKKGQRLYIKGRLLPTLDTTIVAATDVRPQAAIAKVKQNGPSKLPPSGKFKGLVDLHQPQYSLVDLFIEDKLVHVVYTSKTAVKLDGTKAEFTDIQRGLYAQITYRRDQFGRMIASKIELFHGNGS